MGKLIPNRVKVLAPAAFVMIILSFLCANVSEYISYRSYCMDIYPVVWADYYKNRDCIKDNFINKAFIPSTSNRLVLCEL